MRNCADVPSSTTIVNIPAGISVFEVYAKNNSIITLIGPLGRQSLNSDLGIKLDRPQRRFVLTENCDRHMLRQISRRKSHRFKISTHTIKALLEKIFRALQIPYRRKLFVTGVGFKFSLRDGKVTVLQMKLGYSHDIFIKIPSEINIACLNGTKLMLSGYSPNKIEALAAYIRSFKVPDNYKGKGIHLEHEKIRLKDGKT